jgi:hypothetical protein
MRLIPIFVLSGLLATGCDLTRYGPDVTPPAPPTGLYTETGDGFIDLFWNPNNERDVAGYNVFVSSSYNGRYELIGSTRRAEFRDTGARNGNMYYYAVTAYDFDGNESELSRDVAYDVPRPEGYGVSLNDYRRYPSSSGYDFSSYAIVPHTSGDVDMWFENYNGELYMNVRTDTDIQDMGYTGSLLDVRTAPATGWSPTGDVRLRVGHTYVVWTWDDHYAKFRVTSLSQTRVVFDWAYQLQRSNPMLKKPVPVEGRRATGHEEKSR